MGRLPDTVPGQVDRSRVDGATTGSEGTLVLAGSEERYVRDINHEDTAGSMLSVGVESVVVGIPGSVGVGSMLSLATIWEVASPPVAVRLNMLSVGTLSGTEVTADTLMLGIMLESTGTFVNEENNTDSDTVSVTTPSETAVDAVGVMVGVTTVDEAVDAAVTETTVGDDKLMSSLTRAVPLKLGEGGCDESTWVCDGIRPVDRTTDPVSDVIPTPREEGSEKGDDERLTVDMTVSSSPDINAVLDRLRPVNDTSLVTTTVALTFE